VLSSDGYSSARKTKRFVNILYLVQFFNLPDDPGGGRAYHFASRWVEAGHRVTVVTSALNYKTDRISPRARRRLLTREVVEGVEVLRCFSTRGAQGSFGRRLLNFCTFAGLASWICLFKVLRPDVIYVSSPPLTVGIPAFLAAFKWQSPFILEVRDLWPESAVVAGLLRNRALIGLARFFARTLYSRASRVVALTRGIEEEIASCGVDRRKLCFVPNGVDDLLVDLSKTSVPRASSTPFRCLYLGALGTWNGNETLLEAARYLKEDDVEFVFIGDGSQRSWLERRAREWQLDRVHFRGALPKREAVEELRRADICLVCTWNHPFHRMILPNKLFDYLGAGKPVLAAAEGEMAHLLQESGAGFTVPPGDAEGLARLIRQVRSMPAEQRAVMGARGREYALRHFRRRDLADRVERLMAQVVRNRRGGTAP